MLTQDFAAPGHSIHKGADMMPWQDYEWCSTVYGSWRRSKRVKPNCKICVIFISTIYIHMYMKIITRNPSLKKNYTLSSSRWLYLKVIATGQNSSESILKGRSNVPLSCWMTMTDSIRLSANSAAFWWLLRLQQCHPVLRQLNSSMGLVIENLETWR